MVMHSSTGIQDNRNLLWLLVLLVLLAVAFVVYFMRNRIRKSCCRVNVKKANGDGVGTSKCESCLCAYIQNLLHLYLK